jgi:hypothetical protein
MFLPWCKRQASCPNKIRQNYKRFYILMAVETVTRDSFEHLGSIYQTTKRHIPECRNHEVELWIYVF